MQDMHADGHAGEKVGGFIMPLPEGPFAQRSSKAVSNP